MRTAYVGGMIPSLRKPAGVLAIVAGLIVYAGLVARLVSRLGDLPWFVAAPIYTLFGIVWILPLRPLLLWMETGAWRVRR